MPKFRNQPGFRHGAPECLGVLLTNLGTPNAPTPAALRRYLGEFLADPRVVEAPRLLWRPVLNCIILTTRPRRSARLYREIWTEQGSPLLTISQRQSRALQTALDARFSGPVKVVLAMRYGDPSIAAGLETLLEANARRILLLPLYPQYCAATTASAFDAVTQALRRRRRQPELRCINHYHDDPGYIGALAARIRQTWTEHPQPERLLFSFHGIPQQYFEQGDPYHCECQKTARLAAEALDLPQDRWRVSFQSRFGPRQWLKPYTDRLLLEWAGQGVKTVQVVCPGFAADCLETLEEIAIRNRDLFLGAGGRELHYIPALNDSPEHIQALADLVAKHTRGWPETSEQWREDEVGEALQASRRRAERLRAERLRNAPD